MRVLLDTAGYSAFKRGHPEVVQLLRTATYIGLNAIVLGELLSGFAAGAREEQNRRELREFLSFPRVHVLTVGRRRPSGSRSSIRLCGAPARRSRPMRCGSRPRPWSTACACSRPMGTSD